MTRPPTNIRVSFVIVTWNAEDTIQSCIDSIPLRDDVEIIVVDNASCDCTIPAIHEIGRAVQIIPMTSNTGFARACNAGAAEAKGEFLFFLNPDSQLASGSLHGLLSTLTSDCSLFGVAPVEIAPDGRVLSIGERFLSLRGLFARSVLGWKRFRSIERPAAARHVDWISGAALLVRRDRFLTLSGFDTRFWMYVEDMDLCWRAHSNGWTVAVAPTATLIHHGGHSARRNLEATLTSNAIGTLLWFRNTGTGTKVSAARYILLACLASQALARIVRLRTFKDLPAYLHVAVVLLTRRSWQSRLDECGI